MCLLGKISSSFFYSAKLDISPTLIFLNMSLTIVKAGNSRMFRFKKKTKTKNKYNMLFVGTPVLRKCDDLIFIFL